MVFGRRVKYLRNQKGVSQKQLAFEAELEISQISRIERGVINTSIGQLFIISKALDVPLEAFFTNIETAVT